jgi:pyruvate formate lyase activating enzyme
MSMTRREFFRTAGKAAIASGSLPILLKVLGCFDNPAFAAGDYPEASYYEKLSRKRVQCHLCPFEHVLEDGETGPCRVRKNHGGTLRTHGWENPAIIKLDPIEKLPSAHFLPEIKTLTLATGGCNLHCLYCQNWQQSQSKPEDLETVELTSEEAVKEALENEVKAVAFSYTEPFMFYEYALEIAKNAKKKELRVAIATGGHIKAEPLKELCKHVDAITVGLKAFTKECYETMAEGSLDHVKETIKTLMEDTDVWLEITNLVVPTYNDNRNMITEMCKWIKEEMGGDVPLHFGRFVPQYKLKNLPQTPLKSLEEARDIALAEGIRFVYISNVAPHDGNNTYCPKCGKVLVRRVGFKVLENHVKDGKCEFCQEEIPGVWK